VIEVVPEIHRLPSDDDDDDDDDDSSSSVVENHVNSSGSSNHPQTVATTAAVSVSINSELSRVISPSEAGECRPLSRMQWLGRYNGRARGPLSSAPLP